MALWVVLHKSITIERVKRMIDDYTKLDELIQSYAENKSEMDFYKKITDKENAQIKSIMLDEKMDSREVGDYKATCSVSQRESMNEEILLSLFTSVPGFVKVTDEYEIVKQRPYIDFDVLEKAIYDGKLNQDQLLELNKAKEVKEVVTLRITKVKKKKGED